MNRVLKRPMFKRGGSADGITSGLDQKPRQEYSRGTMPSFQLGGLPGFLTGFGINLLAEPPRGNIFQTAAIAARDPFNQLQKFQTAQAVRDEDIAREEKKLAEGREFTESMTDKEIKARAAEGKLDRESRERIAAMRADDKITVDELASQYLGDYDGDLNKATNKARFFLEVRPQLATEVGNTQIGGIIEADLTDTKAAKRFAQQNKNKVGKVFFDINTGASVILTRDPKTNALGFVPYTAGMSLEDDEPEGTNFNQNLTEYQKQVLENIEKSRLKKEEEDKARSLKILQDAPAIDDYTGFDNQFYNQ
mgnify:FL=1